MDDHTLGPQQMIAGGAPDGSNKGDHNHIVSPTEEPYRADQALEVVVGKKALRKLRARRTHQTLWFGLGMFGMIGWSIAVPMLLAITLGIWIDRRWPSPYSWTLMLLFAGALLGSLNAWYWVQRERQLIAREREDTSDETGDMGDANGSELVG